MKTVVKKFSKSSVLVKKSYENCLQYVVKDSRSVPGHHQKNFALREKVKFIYVFMFIQKRCRAPLLHERFRESMHYENARMIFDFLSVVSSSYETDRLS